MRAFGAERAQAAAELVAIVPVLLIAALALGQLCVAGWALLSAGEGARAGARAAHVGEPVQAAARRALPAALEPAVVRADGPEVRVRVEAPALIPGLPAIPVSAAAALDPAAGTP
jgi:hypothetical protein